jgi:hypothetical protein
VGRDASLDSIPVPLNSVINLPGAPASCDCPKRRRLRMPNGSVWLRRWPRPGRSGTVFDVLAHDARYAHTVIIQGRLLLSPPPYLMGQTEIGVMREPATGVQRVVACRFDIR